MTTKEVTVYSCLTPQGWVRMALHPIDGRHWMERNAFPFPVVYAAPWHCFDGWNSSCLSSRNNGRHVNDKKVFRTTGGAVRWLLEQEAKR